jgi:hypothetical protein
MPIQAMAEASQDLGLIIAERQKQLCEGRPSLAHALCAQKTGANAPNLGVTCKMNFTTAVTVLNQS